MKLIDLRNLGINGSMIHVDDYYTDNIMNRNNLYTLCGLSQNKNKTWSENYGMLDKHDLLKKVKLCKKCLKISYKNGYDLVTTVIKRKLTKEINDEE